MRIDTKNKIIYLANPKTGSTSLRKMMDNHNDTDFLNNLKKNNIYHDHWSINMYKIHINNCIKITDVNLSEYFSFTTIRNPWNRVVSGFKYTKSDKNGYPWYHNKYDKSSANSYTFKEFINDLHDKDYWCGIGIPNASYFCFDENNNQIITKIYPIELLTKEIIQKDIIKYTGIHYDIPKIEHLNSTKTVNYRDFYTEQWMIDKVSEVYKKDIELGNYKF